MGWKKIYCNIVLVTKKDNKSEDKNKTVRLVVTEKKVQQVDGKFKLWQKKKKNGRSVDRSVGR